MTEPEQKYQKMNSPVPAFSTPQLAAAALALSVLTGAVFFTDISIVRTPASAAAAENTTEETKPDPFAGTALQAKSAIAVDISTYKTLYELNPDAQLPLASLAKIALVLAAAEVLEPDEYITLANDAYSIGSADILKTGEHWLVRDMIDYTLLGSSNGGATALAAAADERLRALYPDAKQNEAALWRMNSLASELGLAQTYFLNTTGLDESSVVSGSYGSARDVARLLAHALKKERFFTGTAEERLVVWEASGNKAAVAFNTNEALPVIPGLVFGKTGFTDLAGGNLAIVFEPEPAHPVAVVVIGSTQDGRFRDMEELVRRIRDSL